MSEVRLEVDLDVEEGVLPLLPEAKTQGVIAAALAAEGVTRPCLLSLSVVSEERMRELNREWRSIDRPTDVLSLECELPNDPDLAPGEPCELGDIVLAPTYILRQAEEFGTTPADEWRLLVIHGVLHLLGYDHLTDEEARLMEAREEEILGSVATDEAVGRVRLTRHGMGEGA